MDAAAVGTMLTERLGDRVAVSVRSPKRLYARLAPADLPDAFRFLRERLPGCRLGTSTGIDLRDGVGVMHHVVVNGSPLVVTLKVLAPKPSPSVPSLAAQTQAAEWIEREMAEMLGIAFEGHPDARSFLKPASMSGEFPLRRDFDPREFKEKIGERPDF
jgi:NADH-quinone oxidoreductase subunit C